MPTLFSPISILNVKTLCEMLAVCVCTQKKMNVELMEQKQTNKTWSSGFKLLSILQFVNLSFQRSMNFLPSPKRTKKLLNINFLRIM